MSKNETDVLTLAGNSTDFTFRGIGLTFRLKVGNGLSNEDVTWQSEDHAVCTVDEHGVVTATGYGETYVIISYGNQEIKVIVRVRDPNAEESRKE